MIKREIYLQRIRPFIDKDLVKILTGIRRCGKSVMLELIKEELCSQGVSKNQFISVNFEDIDNKSLCTADALHNYVSEKIKKLIGKAYIFFDEIQEVIAFEKCINSLRVKYDVDIYITGSNAKLLSGEFATYLAGRYVEFVIYPFSFVEFIDMYYTINPKANETEVFKQYILFGGMPFLMNLNLQAAPCNQYLQDLYNSVVLKDVMKKNSIRDVDLLERIINYILANVGKTFSATSISKYFKSENRNVSPETISSYIKVCEDAFLFYDVDNGDVSMTAPMTMYDSYNNGWLVAGGGYWKNNNWLDHVPSIWGLGGAGSTYNVGSKDGFGVGYTNTSGSYSSSIEYQYAYLSDGEGHEKETYSRSDGNGKKGFGFEIQDKIRKTDNNTIYNITTDDFSYIGKHFGGSVRYTSSFSSWNGNATSYYVHTYNDATLNNVTFGVSGKTAGISFDITNSSESFKAFSIDTIF